MIIGNLFFEENKLNKYSRTSYIKITRISPEEGVVDSKLYKKGVNLGTIKWGSKNVKEYIFSQRVKYITDNELRIINSIVNIKTNKHYGRDKKGNNISKNSKCEVVYTNPNLITE